MNQKQTDITTGKQIRHLRTQSGMTQEELAGKLNVTRQALSNWERDVNEPDLNTLKKICFLFDVNIQCRKKNVVFALTSGQLICDYPLFQVTIKMQTYFCVFNVTTDTEQFSIATSTLCFDQNHTSVYTAAQSCLT